MQEWIHQKDQERTRELMRRTDELKSDEEFLIRLRISEICSSDDFYKDFSEDMETAILHLRS